MSEERTHEGPGDATAEQKKTAAGPLRPGPAAPETNWAPDAPPAAGDPAPERRAPEVGDLEQRAAARRRDGLRRDMGLSEGQAAGWLLFLVGGLVYLHAVWATANAVLTGAGRREQVISFGGIEFLEGTLGIALLVIGLLLAIVFTFAPVRYVPRLVPGTLEYEVAADNVVRMRDRRRILAWTGLAVFLVGLLVAAYPLKASVAEGELWRLSFGGNGYRIHFWGYLIAAVGIALSVPFLVTQSGADQAAAVADGALQGGRVRRARGGGEADEADATDAGREPIGGWTGARRGGDGEPAEGPRSDVDQQPNEDVRHTHRSS